MKSTPPGAALTPPPPPHTMVDMGENSPQTAASPQKPRRRRLLRFTLVCLLQVAAWLLLAESVVRFGGFDRPLAGSVSFAANAVHDPIHRIDSLLFYSLRPNLRTRWQAAPVSTNSLGLRGPEIRPKQPDEFRILSLGESSTFGAGVADDQTYSTRLGELLQQRDSRHRYRVVNAGVSGYTSFQSWKYLEQRGLELHPDLVLFYHEINDSLPAEYSDRELYESRSHHWHRGLAEWSAAYRALSHHMALHNIEADRAKGQSRVPEQPPRVSADERRAIFGQLAEVCRRNGIALVLIHPAYAATKPHACELTEFCSRTGVPLYDAFESLHPPGAAPRACFADECHPNVDGHEALAAGLCEFLVQSRLVPPAQR